MAEKAAPGKDVMVGGGASVAKQFLAAGLLDEIEVHLVPVFLGDGLRVFDDAGLAEPTSSRCVWLKRPASPT